MKSHQITDVNSFVEALTDWAGYPTQCTESIQLTQSHALSEADRQCILKLLNPTSLVMSGFELEGKDTPVTLLKEALESKVDSVSMHSLSLLPENQRVTLIGQLDKVIQNKEEGTQWGTPIPERTRKKFFVKNMKQAEVLKAQLDFYGIAADVHVDREGVEKILETTADIEALHAQLSENNDSKLKGTISVKVMGSVPTAAGLNEIKDPMHLDSYLVKDSGHRWVYLSVGRKTPGWCDTGTYQEEEEDNSSFNSNGASPLAEVFDSLTVAKSLDGKLVAKQETPTFHVIDASQFKKDPEESFAEFNNKLLNEILDFAFTQRASGKKEFLLIKGLDETYTTEATSGLKDRSPSSLTMPISDGNTERSDLESPEPFAISEPVPGELVQDAHLREIKQLLAANTSAMTELLGVAKITLVTLDRAQAKETEQDSKETGTLDPIEDIKVSHLLDHGPKEVADTIRGAYLNVGDADPAWNPYSGDFDKDSKLFVLALRHVFNNFCEVHKFKALRDSIIGQVNYHLAHPEEQGNSYLKPEKNVTK